MLRLARGPAPEILQAHRSELLGLLWDRFSTDDVHAAYVDMDFWKEAFFETGIGDALYASSGGKCVFCESLLGDEGLQVGHIRPRGNTINFDGAHFPRHYFWLAFEWSNLVPMCLPCSQSRGNRFPLADESGRVEVPDSPEFDVVAMEVQIVAEPALLLDPTRNDPAEHLAFELSTGLVASRSQRGEVTIELFNLNRVELVEARLATAAEVRDALAGGAAAGDLTGDGLPFTAVRRAVVAEGDGPGSVDALWELVNKSAAFVVDVERTPQERARPAAAGQEGPQKPKEKQGPLRSSGPPRDPSTRGMKSPAPAPAPAAGPSVADAKSFAVTRKDYYRQSRKVEKVVLRDFRSIEELTLHMAPGDADSAGWTVLLGENGTGKSTVLHGIALALAGHSYREDLQGMRRLDPRAFVRRSAEEPVPESGSVEVYLSGLPDPVVLKVVADELDFIGDFEAPVLLLGYGSTRLLPRGGPLQYSGAEHARVDNLFDPFVPLGDAREFLLELSPDDFEPAAAAFAALLNLGSEVRLEQNRRAGRIDVHLFNTTVPLEQLSDGYQSVIALASDIMSVLRKRWGSMAVAEGIVLLDELGAHLHPKWRMGIVKSLRQTFPRVQFIVTTHDPLCLRGLRPGEVIVMRRGPNRRVVANADLPPTEGLRVDQLLTSEHFGLQSTVDPDVERDFEQYYDLLSEVHLGPAEEKKLAALRKRFGQRRLLGETRRERLMLTAIDRFLATEAGLADASERRSAEDDLERDLEDILESLEV